MGVRGREAGSRGREVGVMGGKRGLGPPCPPHIEANKNLTVIGELLPLEFKVKYFSK